MNPQAEEINEAIERMARQWDRSEERMLKDLRNLRDDLGAMTAENTALRAVNADLMHRYSELLELCDEQDRIAEEFRVPCDDGSLDVTVIRKVLGA